MYSRRKKFKMQGKTTAHQKSVVLSQVIELIRNGRIKTTPKKAKILKQRFDKLITQYKKEGGRSVQKVRSFFRENDRAYNRLGQIVTTYLQDRDSGYTRVIKTLPRKGDNAPQAYVMLVNFEPTEKTSKVQKALQKQSKDKK